MRRHAMRTLAAALVVASIGCQQVPIRPPVERSSVGLVEPAIEAAAEPSQLPAEPTIEQTSATQEITPLPPVRAALLIENEAIDPGAAQPAHAPNESPMLRLSLFDAIETGLLQNPDLTVLRQNEGVSLGALGVARTYPFNPYIQVQATPIQSQKADTVHDTIYQYVLVMQTIQLAHQQRRREEIGMAALTSVRWNILQAELLNVAQTERLYFTALYQRGIRDLVRQNADLNQELLATSQRQLEAGHVSGADVAIVRIDSQSTQTQAELAEANYQTALLDLRRQLNIPLEQPLDLTGELTDWQWLAGDADRLLEAKCPGSCVVAAAGSMAAASEAIADLVSGRPDVLAARADLAAARANTQLANASRVPDIQIGPYYQRTESGTTYWGFRMHNDIPIINNGVPLLRQRQQELRQRQVQWEQLFARARIEAQVAIDRYQRARRLVEASPAAAANDLPEALRGLEAQFRASEVDVLRVFTARTSLIQLRRAYLDLLNELAQSAAGVTAATAVPPEALVQLRL